MFIAIQSIRTDGGTQPRAVIDFDAVEDYAEAMGTGIKFPKIVVFYDGADYWLADGFHRLKAAFAADFTEVDCDVHQGTLQDAQWFSFSANQSHGLRRTNEDKQRCVKAALVHPNCAGLSDTQIAKHLGVDIKTIGNWRGKLSMEIPKIASRTVTRNGTTYQQNVSNIGRTRISETAVAVCDEPIAQPAAKPLVVTARAFETNPASIVEVSVGPNDDEYLQQFLVACAAIGQIGIGARSMAEYISARHDRETILEIVEMASDYIRQVIR